MELRKTNEKQRSGDDRKTLLFFFMLTGGVCLLTVAAGHIGRAGPSGAPPLALPLLWRQTVWMALCLPNAYAAHLTWRTEDTNRVPAVRLYIMQLAVGGVWPFLFHIFDLRLVSFFLCMLQAALSSLCAAAFRPIHPRARVLLIPHQLWCLYSAYVLLGINVLNR